MKRSNKKERSDLFYISFILFIWFSAYILSFLFLDSSFEFDEAKYLANARGIAENFDFSSRSNTVMGLIKYGFPQHTTHYPLNSLYIAIFFKLLGASLNTAYFATWVSGLLVCIFLYLTLKLLTDGNKSFSFYTAISFLFLPRVLNLCNSALMEIPGCALIVFLIFLIFKNLKIGRLNPLFLAFAVAWLYLYKSLFIGVIFGLLVLIFISYNLKLTKTKMPLYLNIFLFLLTSFLIYFIFTKFIFLKLGPWLVFDIKQVETGTYADFDGGFTKDIAGNLSLHIGAFFKRVIPQYFPFITARLPEGEAVYILTPCWFELATYFLVILYSIVFSFFLWKNFNPLQKVFIFFSFTSIICFNLILICITGTSAGSLCRYNMIYIPILLLSSSIVIYKLLEHFNELISRNKKALTVTVVSFLFIVYLPYFYSGCLVRNLNDSFYYAASKRITEAMKKFIGDAKPSFVYSQEGTFITWDMYPVRDIFMQATNEEIKMLNRTLPRPIEYLFISPEQVLFKQNQELITSAKPIVDGAYNFIGYDKESNLIVYKYGLVN